MIFFELFWTFFKIGLFTFGGGYAMIPLIQSEVLSKAWMTGEELINFIAVSESTPGPFAVNISTYIGSIKGGEVESLGFLGNILGSACATLGVVLPSFIIISIIAKFYLKFKANKYVAGTMSGLRPCAIALIFSAIISMGSAVFFPAGVALSVFATYEFWASAVICVGMIVLVFRKVHPIAVICISAVLGILAGYGQQLLV